MAGFIERNKKKGLLALLLYIARRGKTAAGAAMTLVVVGLVLFLGTPEAVRQRVPWAPRGLLTRGMDTSNSGLGADEVDVAMRLSEEKGEGMEALTRRMLNAISGPRQPGVDMVAAKNTDLQEPSAQKQLGDKLSKQGRGIRGIVRKEDSSRGSASIALSPQELQRGLSNGPDQITQPQSSLPRNTPGGAPIGGDSSSDFSGQAQIGRQAEAGAPSEAGGPPEVGGPPPDTTSLITGGGEPIPEARAGDANFDLMAGTYGGGSSGGKADMEGDPCSGNRRAQGCVQWKTEKDKSKKEDVNPALLGYANDSSPATYQLAEVKAYSFAAAPTDIKSDTLVTRKGQAPTVITSKGQCDKDRCPKEYASMVSDAPFQRRTSEKGLVKLDDEGVDIGGIPDSAMVADYAKQVKDMDEAAKDCEEAARGEKIDKGYAQYGKGLMNDFMKASNDYLTAIKNMGRLFGQGDLGHYGNAQASPESLELFMECGSSAQNREQDWKTKQGVVKKELDDATNACKAHTHQHCSGSGPSYKCVTVGDCGVRCHSAEPLLKRMTIATDRQTVFTKNNTLCMEHAGKIKDKCERVRDAVKKKRGGDCQATNTEYNIADSGKGDYSELDCNNLVWKSDTGGNIGTIVQLDNMGRDSNFKPTQ